jgi:hypothetical protein
MLDGTYQNHDIPEPLQPPQLASHEKTREAAGWRQKIWLVLIGVIAGAALVAGGYALGGNHAANLAPLQKQVTTLQQDVNFDNAKVASDGSQISSLNQQVASLNVSDGELLLNGLKSYDETCPLGGVWVPCAKNEPPGFGAAS